jgi:hypothetical protein
MAEHHKKIDPAHKCEIDDGKTFQLGSPDEALDFATLNNTLYGFYTMRDIEITAIECMVTEAMMCADTAGVALLTDASGGLYASVTAVDNTALNGHMSGVPGAGAIARVSKGTMLFMKTVTASDEGTSETGQGYFHIEYK